MDIGYVSCEISKGMYSLSQSGIIAQQLPDWIHTKQNHPRPLEKPETADHFCLVVVDFAIKYTRKEDVHHLLNTL
jgi:hypothetical protein